MSGFLSINCHARLSCLFILTAVLSACGHGHGEDSAATQHALTPNQSNLWGASGELFDPAGRLMDWSYAGYRAGEATLPALTPTLSVTDHGATPDDNSDDTAAFEAALSAAEPGDVVGVPAGTFIIKKTLTLTDGVVLQGAGPAKTILDVPVSLTDAYGNPGLSGGGTSTYSFGAGFIEADGSDGGQKLADVTQAAKRGDTKLNMATTAGISVGDWIQIEQTDVKGDLLKRLHADLMLGGSDNIGDKGMDFYTRVTAVSAGGVQVERALPVDIELAWTPTVKSVEPKSSEVGVEHLAIVFPKTTYPGHFNELGFNAIHFHNMQDSWVRNVRIVDSDYAVNVTGGHFVTVQDVVIDATAGRSGHHGLNNGFGGDNLYIGFDIRTQMVHDITNEWYSTGVVVTQGRAVDLAMDHHRSAPYATLWTELDCGAGTRPFRSGGSTNRGPHTAAYDTLWNVTASKDMGFPGILYGPRMNFVGFRTAETAVISPYDWWLESISPEDLDPPNLWLAMRKRRLGGGAGGSGGGAGVGPGGASSGGAAGLGSGGSAADDDDSGCGCRVPGRTGRGMWWLFALVLLPLVARRRRPSNTSATAKPSDAAPRPLSAVPRVPQRTVATSGCSPGSCGSCPAS